ncbi:popeye domain-containing 2 isoform X2 [Chiloscyllium plagiosum]|uniref:popeye domain-containing 2 isoform X2 n=1 Tax=Chiloscyllium plagiosum TaxID=36176 RepID=UPI001CB7C123|nr:popeye domain-containing 2 isoform X2 [Chiloscyllium plagiosum]
MFRENSSFIETILYDSPGCKILKNGSEGAIYHLANVMFTLGYMSGSGFFGLVYLFSLLGVGFFIQSLWGWVDACGVDIFMWSLLLFVFCLVQLAHIGYRLRKVNFEEDFTNLYKAMFQPLDVPLGVYKEIVNCCDAEVTSLSREQNYAVEGKTAIDRLSLLLSGRVRVTHEQQFLHYIFPYQFLDSPEWESLRPNEEGNFQVTLTAETDCYYVTWKRRKLYMLLAKHHYIARLFTVMLGNDIADKLYSLIDKLYCRGGVRYDIRLPSLYHVLAPSVEAEKETIAESPHHVPQSSFRPQECPFIKPGPDINDLIDVNSSWSGIRKGHAPLAPTQTPEL